MYISRNFFKAIIFFSPRPLISSAIRMQFRRRYHHLFVTIEDGMIITTNTELEEFARVLREFPAIFVDTEFVGEGRYYPDLGAIQVSAGEHAAIVDPLALRDLSPLLEILIDPAIEKVFHAAVQDLSIFHRLLNQPVAPVFDTQVAAALLGYEEQISFANLVERVTGVRLSKAHSFTDWLRRPLSPGQVTYALDDVRYLPQVHERLTHELRELGRTAWAREEFSKLEEPTRFMPADPRELYLRFRGVERMGGPALAALRELAAWREEQARALNIPTGKIARDEVLIELARHPHQSVKELRDVRGMTQQQVERFGAGLIAAAQQSTTAPRPSFRRLPPLPVTLEATVDFLTLCLRSLASEEAIAPGLVATRSDLVALVLRGDQADISLMRGWRRAAIGDALLATLEGKATARVIPESRRVHLEWHQPA
jgi:ribonuclease D